MSDEKKPRAGTMSDEARALEAMQRRRAASEPIHEPDEEDFTPVGVVIERIEADLGDALSPREKRIVIALRRSDANQEFRARQRRDTGDTAALEKRVDAVEADIVDIAGKSRNNGKLGTLKGRLDAFLGRAWAVLLLLLGGVGAAAVKLVIVGRAYGELETKVQANAARIQLLESVVFLKSFPAASPGKEQQ